MSKPLYILVSLFEKLESWWQGHLSSKLISAFLLAGFLTGLGIVFIQNNTSWLIGWPLHRMNYFLAVDIAFTLLLIIEILGLIFVLPRSVADSVGKQFEILSIILLRSAFKEFGSYDQPISWNNLEFEPLYHMLSDAIGALVVFLLIGLYYRNQKHERITKDELEQDQFIRFKKFIGLFLLLAFGYLGVVDITGLIQTGKYDASFNAFYTLLIFSDVLVLLYSLRYSTRYSNLFRYSSFALATVLIRLSLSAPPYINVALGIGAGLFVLGLTYVYNYFLSSQKADDHQ